MLGRMLAVALAAGIVAGLAISAVQSFTTTPLILAAEAYEEAALGDHDHAHGAWTPEDGLERTFFTVVANVITGAGFGLLLVAAFAVYGKGVGARRGVLWGAAGFAVFALSPSLGLPPEVPGTAAADLAVRQVWWAFAAACTALGLGLLAFGRRAILAALGVLALVLPHAVGAPHPANIGGPVPPEIAARFVATSLAVAAVFWVLLGAATGALYRRFV
jgi:cobalt transporter subunit CbtA